MLSKHLCCFKAKTHPFPCTLLLFYYFSALWSSSTRRTNIGILCTSASSLYLDSQLTQSLYTSSCAHVCMHSSSRQEGSKILARTSIFVRFLQAVKTLLSLVKSEDGAKNQRKILLRKSHPTVFQPQCFMQLQWIRENNTCQVWRSVATGYFPHSSVFGLKG